MLLLALAACRGNVPGTLSVTGQIEGNPIHAGSKVGGRITEVLAEEGTAVDEGAPLIRIEADEAEAALAAARAQLAQAEAVLAKLEAGARAEEIRQAEAAVAQAREQYAMAQRGPRPQEIAAARANADTVRARRDEAENDFARVEQLYTGKAVSRQMYDKAKAARDAAAAQYTAAQEQVNLLEEGTRAEQVRMAKAALDQAQAVLDQLIEGARSEDIEAAKAARDAAAAAVDRAQTVLREMTVVSPRKGVIDSLDVRAGDLIGPGPVVEIIDPEDLKLTVYVGAAILGRLRVGQEVTLTTDAFGEETFAAVIAFIANEGEFTPRNLQTEEERVQQVFEVKLRLDSAGGKLRPGMAATAHFDLAGTEQP